jgi:ABC-type glycerol-3-phosphate transport system permease component
LPFGIWLLVAFFRQLPDEVEEAAALDGCVGVRFVVRFVLPMFAPGITATGVWAFIYGWNEYMFSLTFLSGASDKWPITIGVSSSQGLYSISWQALMISSIFGAVPVLVVFLIFRRQLEAGLSGATVR